MDMWLTDTDIEAVLAGNPPHDRPDLADLSAAIERLQDDIPSQPVAWSAELAAMFDQTGGSDTPTPASEPVRRRVLRWAAGLGLAGQAVLASTGAAAAMVVGGLTGVLPDPAQRVFDDIVHRQERPPATPPSPATPARQTLQDAEDRREALSNGAPADQRKAEPRRTSRDLTVDGTRRPSVPAASASAEQAPPASRNTGDAGADRSGSDAPVAPMRPTRPAEDPDDDLEDAEDDRKDDRKDDLEEAEDDRTDDLEEAEDDRRDDLEEAEDVRRDGLEDAADRAEDYEDAS